MTARPRLRNNMLANLAGTAVTAAAAVMSAPLIYRWMGADAYGLVGIYVLLQTLMPLFDAGFTAGLAHAVAWHRSRSLGKVRTLVQAAGRPVIALAGLFLLVATLGAGPAAQRGLANAALPVGTVHIALWCMAGALAIRLVAGLGRATLMALELQSRANTVQALAAIARTLGALGFALVTGTGVLGFFAVQVPISLAEYVMYRQALQQCLPVDAVAVPRAELLRHLRFALAISGLSAAWLLTSQVDKLLLAGHLSLPGYGAYSLGVHVASVILLAVGTVHSAVLPRLTRHVAEEDETRLGALYGIATTLTVAMSCAFVVAIALGATTLVPSLRVPVDGIDPMRIAWMYGIGNAGTALLAMAYQLQNAYGVMRLHALGTVLQMFVQVPLLAWSAASGDAWRTAVVFACVNWAFVLCWLPIVHRRFLPGGHWHWALYRLAPSLVAGTVAGALMISLAQALPGTGLWGTPGLALAAGVTFAAAAGTDTEVRAVVRRWMVTAHAG